MTEQDPPPAPPIVPNEPPEAPTEETPLPIYPGPPLRVRKRRYILYFVMITALLMLVTGNVRVFHQDEQGFVRLQRLYGGTGPIRTAERLPTDPEMLAQELNIELSRVREAEHVLNAYQNRLEGMNLGIFDWAVRFNIGDYTVFISYQIFLNMAVAGIIAAILFLRARDRAAREVIDRQNHRFRELNERLEGKVLEAQQLLQQLQRTQDKLVGAEKLASVGRLSATLAHEIRNPLSIMKSAAGMAMEDFDRDAPQAQALEMIRGEIDRLNKIITELLDFARPKPARLDAHNLNFLVKSWLTRVKNQIAEDGVEIEIDLAEDLPLIAADSDQLYQVFLNVLFNARDALKPNGGGTIDIVTEPAGERGVFLEIHDDGPGMDPETLQQIYEPFFTTKTHGSGLGLPLVQQLMEGMGGNAYIESTPGAGTAVHLFLRTSDIAKAEETATTIDRIQWTEKEERMRKEAEARQVSSS
ncbi:MAG: ATP-binding protein [Sumerlaeia bacterium]